VVHECHLEVEVCVPKPTSASSFRSPRFGRSVSERRIWPYERLKQAILAGEILPGEQLVEVALAEWCGVSRTPIREALTRLEQDGLVVRKERGLTVRESTPEQVLDLYESRLVLESKAAEVAAERRTSHDLLAMRRAAEHASRPEATDGDALAETNREFHRSVWRASHNESLIDLLERLNMHLGRYPATTLVVPGRRQTAEAQHRELVDAIERRDVEAAGRVATTHFTDAREIRLRIWASE
jgi:DNA-binding GntR family transcriptional regulator